MEPNRSVIIRGAIAGAVAATAVALFFLLVDALGGRPLATPTFLAGVLFGSDGADAGLGGIVLYTVFHYVGFMSVGAAVAWALDRARLPAALLLGLVVGFLLFDLVFYASIWLTGVDVVESLGWPLLLAGNLLAGLVLVAYLRRTSPRPQRGWGELVRDHPTLREGLVAGLVGAVAVAAWFFVLDLALGRPFFTPAAFGSALFFGVDDSALVQITAATVLGYTALHLAAFLATGLVFAGLLAQADEHPPVLLALVLLFVTFETLVIGLVAIMASWLLDVLPWWTIALGNLVAALSMGAYLWKKHPRLIGDMDRAEHPAGETPRGAGPATGPRVGGAAGAP